MSFDRYEAGYPVHCPVGWTMLVPSMNERWRRIPNPKDHPGNSWDVWAVAEGRPEIEPWKLDAQEAAARRVWIEVPHAPAAT